MNEKERAICDEALARIRDAERDICGVVLKCIHHEKRNFEHLAAGKPYSEDPLHKKAVTQYSFEELDNAMSYLSHVLELRGNATELSLLTKQELCRPAERRDAAGILATIVQLEPQLETLASC